MSAFLPAFRRAFLYLSTQAQVRQWFETSGQASKLTQRFVAGTELESALAVTENLRSAGMLSSLDYLGENVSTLEEAATARRAYLAALDEIALRKLPATVSLKVTSVGLDVSEDECRANTEALVSRAREIGSRVECDMEDSSYTDRNLSIVYDMHERHRSVRAVIQAYLYRSEADIAKLNELGVPVRLCKGAYREPASIAWPDKRDVDANYVKLMHQLFDRGHFPAIATHDPSIVDQAMRYTKAHGIGPERFEFQMLYGIQRELQRRVVRNGFQLRLYVPYGAAWYPYFMRRLAERPANVWFILKNLFQS